MSIEADKTKHGKLIKVLGTFRYCQQLSLIPTDRTLFGSIFVTRFRLGNV